MGVGKLNSRWLFINIFLSISILPMLFGCTPTVLTTNASCQERVSVAYTAATEESYCSTVQVYSSPVTITGQATFQARPYTTNSGLGNIGSAQPIRYAEIIAYNASGAVTQCAETNNTGNFSLQLPTSTDTYKIQVRSRGSNTHVHASVLNCPEENVPYAVETSFTPNVSKSVGIINADAVNTGPLLGAAFNIFEQILQANEFLQAQVGTCAFTGCTTVSVAPKVQAYWAKGFNPNSYFDSSSGISFYIPGYSHLFILGGIDGDIYNSDTDHFDNSIIIHEYGHFLEDVYTHSDSPGGSHSGNSVIDPRLAWSEGWGNFIQAAVRNQARYRDSQGTPNAAGPVSTSGYIFNIPIETPSGSCSVGSIVPGCDIPEFASEGNFREFSVTRMLWDAFDENVTNPDSIGDESVNSKFKEIWASLTSNLGFNNAAAAFRNVGLLHFIQSHKLAGASDWSSLLTLHSQAETDEYARYVTNTGACSKIFSMTPYDDPNDNGSFTTSHLLRNNDFLHIKLPAGSHTITLKYLTVDAGGNGYLTERAPDLDLYLYNSSAQFGNSADIVASSETYWDNNPNNEQQESLTTSTAAGDYLINVKVFTGRYLLDSNSSTNNCVGTGFRRICENDGGPNYNFVPAGDPVTYELLLDGVNLCPATLF